MAPATRWRSMTIRVVSFLALVSTALALAPAGARLFALPNKIGMTQEQYFIAQAAYRGWALLGAVLIPAMLLNIALAFLLRGEQPAFALAIAGSICMAATLPIFFMWVYPGNAATQNWIIVPADWEALRRHWEYGHAVNAGLNFLAFCLMTLAALTAPPCEPRP